MRSMFPTSRNYEIASGSGFDLCKSNLFDNIFQLTYDANDALDTKSRATYAFHEACKVIRSYGHRCETLPWRCDDYILRSGT